MAAPTSAEPTAPPLPAGWVSAVDPSSGATYYWHAATQTNTWQRPAP